jgi:hypothetical protein
MSLVASYPFTDFSLIQGVAGNGKNVAGASYPQGIPNVLTIQEGMLRAYVTDSHAKTDSGHRAEIYLTPDTLGENWYSWEFMLPPAYWADYTGGALTCGQMHESPDSGDAPRQPNFMLQIMSGMLYVVWPRATLPAESTSYDRFPVTNLEWGRWYSVCLRVNWQITTAGFREVLIDRVPVYRQWGVPTAYDDVVQPYFKLGIYNTSGGLSGDKVAYFRNLTRWTGNDGYQAVLGGAPLTRPALSQI